MEDKVPADFLVKNSSFSTDCLRFIEPLEVWLKISGSDPLVNPMHFCAGMINEAHNKRFRNFIECRLRDPACPKSMMRKVFKSPSIGSKLMSPALFNPGRAPFGKRSSPRAYSLNRPLFNSLFACQKLCLPFATNVVLPIRRDCALPFARRIFISDPKVR